VLHVCTATLALHVPHVSVFPVLRVLCAVWPCAVLGELPGRLIRLGVLLLLFGGGTPGAAPPPRSRSDTPRRMRRMRRRRRRRMRVPRQLLQAQVGQGWWGWGGGGGGAR
jgi:hypothetical protein